MWMEINGVGVIAANPLDPSLTNMPIKYDDQKVRDPLPTHLNQPRDPLSTHLKQPRDLLQTHINQPLERLPSIGKKHKPRTSGNKISENKKLRHTTTQTHTDPRETTSRNLKRDKPEDHLPFEEELKQNEKRSKAMECNPKNITIKMVEAAG